VLYGGSLCDPTQRAVKSGFIFVAPEFAGDVLKAFDLRFFVGRWRVAGWHESLRPQPGQEGTREQARAAVLDHLFHKHLYSRRD
jgi:hypothetical protein